MFKDIFLSVVAFILATLAVMELIHYRQNRRSGWESEYFFRRLLRRCSILGILEGIVLSALLSDFLKINPDGAGWKLIYLICCLLLVFIVFILVLKDIAETVKFATRKHSEITLQSIDSLKRSETRPVDSHEVKRDG